MAKKDTNTLVTFLLDRSGSMDAVKGSTIDSFNTYLDELTKNGTGILFSLVQFDTQSIDKTCVRTPVAKATRLDNLNYQPRGGTPLVDASYKTIKAVEASLNGDKKTKVVICIQTDGHENASTEYSFADLTTLIKEKTKDGWQFNFMGAGIDAYDQASKMGLAYAQTMSYNHTDPNATRNSFVASAANTQSFAAGLSQTTNYSNAQRSASGDAHMQNYDPAALAKQHGLQGGAVGVSMPTGTSAMNPPPTPKLPRVKPVAVDDFTL